MKTLISAALWLCTLALIVGAWTILHVDKSFWLKAAYTVNVLMLASNLELIRRSRELRTRMSRPGFRRLYIMCLAILSVIILAPWGVRLILQYLPA